MEKAADLVSPFKRALEHSSSPTTVTDALGIPKYSTLYHADDLEVWRQTEKHATFNGVVCQRPFHGQWDAYQADIDACQERVNLERGLLAVVKRSDNLAADLEAAVNALLTEAALPMPLSKQIFSDALSIGHAATSMCPSGSLEIKLECAGENICSRWHQDNFVGRALTCYTGVEGTEYTGDENVDFWELVHCGNNDCIIRDSKHVHSIDVGDILFIKGKTYEGSPPLVHRSPAKRYHADGRILNRLILKVDVSNRNDGTW